MENNIIVDLRYTMESLLTCEVTLEKDENKIDIESVARSAFHDLTKYFLGNGVGVDVLYRAIEIAEYVHGLKQCKKEESRGTKNES